MFAGAVNEESETVLARLHADIDQAATLNLDSCTDDQLLALWRDLETVRNRLAAVDHRIIAETQTRHLDQTSGARSMPALAKHLLHIGAGEARARVHAADALGPRRALTGEALPPIYEKTAHAMEAGQISSAAARVIVDTVEKLPDGIRAVEDRNVEATLVDLAGTLHLDHLRTAAAKTADVLDPDGRLKDEKYRDRTRRLDLHRRADGSGHLDGEVTAELAEWLQTVFDAHAAPKPETDGVKDPRTAAQRRHDGLLDALKHLARADQFPTAGGVTTTVLLYLSAQAARATTAQNAVDHANRTQARYRSRESGLFARALIACPLTPSHLQPAPGGSRPSHA